MIVNKTLYLVEHSAGFDICVGPGMTIKYLEQIKAYNHTKKDYVKIGDRLDTNDVFSSNDYSVLIESRNCSLHLEKKDDAESLTMKTYWENVI